MNYSFIKAISNYLFPKQCIICGNFSDYLCFSCQKKLIKSQNHKCHVCKQSISDQFVHNHCAAKTHLDGVLVCITRNKAAKMLVHQMKYSLYYDIGHFLSKYYKEKIQYLQQREPRANFTLVPVPLFKNKKWSRGFNQAEKIALQIGQNQGLEVKNLIKRVKNTRTQVGLSRKQRLINLENAFEINEMENLNGSSNVILIDDVVTTGSTLEKCAKVLRDKGVKKIYAVCLFRD